MLAGWQVCHSTAPHWPQRCLYRGDRSWTSGRSSTRIHAKTASRVTSIRSLTLHSTGNNTDTICKQRIRACSRELNNRFARHVVCEWCGCGTRVAREGGAPSPALQRAVCTVCYAVVALPFFFTATRMHACQAATCHRVRGRERGEGALLPEPWFVGIGNSIAWHARRACSTERQSPEAGG